MAGLAWGQLITAAIVAFVVIVSLKVGGETIAHAADKLDILGIQLGAPSINSFTATPDGKGNMRFMLSLGGSTSGVGLQIYKLYTPTPDKDLTKMAPDFKKENLVFDLISSREATGQKLTDQLKKGVITQLCPYDAAGTSGKEGCHNSAYISGGYRFVAVLKKKGKEIDQKDAITGFYTESDLELLNTPVSGCNDPGFHDCNVIECKKSIINRNSFETVSQYALRVRKPLVEDISEKFRNERGISKDNKCGTVDKGTLANTFRFEGCTKEDIDALNIKVVRARLLEKAFQDTGSKVTSEDHYNGYLDTDSLDRWKVEAVKATMSCTTPLGWLNAPKGANSALQSLGWQLVPIGETPKIWKGWVNDELNKVLENVMPGIAKLKPQISSDNTKIELTWGVPIGSNRLAVYTVANSYTRWGGEVTAENKKEKVFEKTISAKDGGKLVTAYTITSEPADAPLRMGKYDVEVTLRDDKSNALFSDTKSAGIFNDAYVETYKGGDKNCQTADLTKDSPDLRGKFKCNVDAIKRYALSRDSAAASAAYAKSKVDKASCTINSNGELSGNCKPEEVDTIYHAYLIGRGAADAYGCVFPANTQLSNAQSNAKLVCTIKRQVVDTLNANSWKDVRVKKGWEKNV